MNECPNCGGYNVLTLDEEDFEKVWVECLDCGYAWPEVFPEEIGQFPANEQEKDHLLSEAYGSDDERDVPDEGESQWDV